jgi:hypothetical protein
VVRRTRPSVGRESVNPQAGELAWPCACGTSLKAVVLLPDETDIGPCGAL